jgi:hypothetical protein
MFQELLCLNTMYGSVSEEIYGLIFGVTFQLLTDVSRSEVVDRPRPSIENKHYMHAHTITVKLQAFFRVLDSEHQMVKSKVCRCW